MASVPPRPVSAVTRSNTASSEVTVNELPSTGQFAQARESIPSNSGDGAPSTDTPSWQTERQDQPLINRVAYFSLLVAICAPIANFFLTYKAMDLGVTFNIMTWVLFGIFWCGTFAMLLGPIFAMVSVFVRLFDVVPALGSSLWVLLSIRLTTAVINDSLAEFPGFLNNLPLFGLIFANGVAALPSLQYEFKNTRTNVRGLTDNGTKDGWLTTAFGYVFRDGKCGLHDIGMTPSRQKFNLPLVSVPDTFLQPYQCVRDNSRKYLRGEDLADFDLDFGQWQTEARRLQRSFWMRRLFCLVGYVIETAALYFSFVFLNELKAHTGKEDKNSSPLSLLLPIWQIILVVLISFLSHYLWTLLNIESTCTTRPEVSSMMLRRLESHINWSGPQSGYLTNGKLLRLPWSGRKYGRIKAGELPTIGIVLDDDGVETGLTTLRSTVSDCRLRVTRIGPEIIRTNLLREDEPERAGLEHENVTISERDRVI